MQWSDARTLKPISQVFKAASWKDRKLKKMESWNKLRKIHHHRGRDRESRVAKDENEGRCEAECKDNTPPRKLHTFSSLETLWSFASHSLDQSTYCASSPPKICTGLQWEGVLFTYSVLSARGEAKSESLPQVYMFTCKIHGTSHIFITSLAGHLVAVDYPFYSAPSLHSRHHPTPWHS